MAGVRASKPLVLVHLALTVAVAVAFDFVAWPAALILLTASIYLRAAWVVGLARNRTRLMLHSPALVLQLGWLTLGGLVRREPATWDRTPRPTERQAA
jgi:hypothetical protein